MTIPKNIQGLNQELKDLAYDERCVFAQTLADKIITSDIFGDSDDAWLIRQLLKYINPEKQESYISYILTTNNTLKNKWLGEPFEPEGAVRMMESVFDEKAWTLILEASPFTLNQRIRILNKLMNSGAERLWKSFMDVKLKTAWHTPENWPGLEKLKNNDVYILWSAYVALNNIETLKSLAPKIGFSTWANELEYRPSAMSNYYSTKHTERVAYIKARMAAEKNLELEQKLELPEFESMLF